MIIGVIGKKRSGKDTFADYVMEHSSKDFVKYSFATPVKEICKTAFLLSDEQLYGEEKEDIDDRWGVSARKLMQVIGTDLFRDLLPKIIPEFKDISVNLWVKHFEFYCKENKDKNIVIPDVRFQNEVDTILRMGGIVIQVTSDRRIVSEDGHSSENVELTGMNVVIQNNDTLFKYYEKIKETMEKYSV